MKGKSVKILQLIAVIIIGIGACVAVYFLVDRVWNGSFVDWFEYYFMQTRNAYLPEAGQEAIIREPMWWKVKRLLLAAFIVVVIVNIITAFVAARFYAKSVRRKTITSVSLLRQL